MKVLAIDTSSIVATVAIMDDQKLICEYTVNHKKTHSQKLMPLIDEVLKSCELKINDIDLFAVSIGPGSFTGLRIGVATIKAFAHALNKPLIGISTLDALALNGSYFNGIICPIIDGNGDQVYTSLYKWENNNIKIQSDYLAISIYELIDILKEKNEQVIFVGDGVNVFKDIIKEKMSNLSQFGMQYNLLNKASFVAQLAIEKYNSGYVDDYMTLTPIYLRKSQAERMLENAKST